MDAAEFSSYIQRGLFFEAVGRTVSGFVGAIARKEAVLEFPAALQPIVDDATADGLSLNELTKQLCSEAILQGRAGVLVDYDEKASRPYLSMYEVEAITNWSNDGIVLHETVFEADPDDAFRQKAIEQYRQLSIADGVYSVVIWRKSVAAALTTEWVIHETIIPTNRGRALDAIPFFWVTPIGKTSRIERPPLLGLVNVCLSHYRNSVDLEHGLHYTALPTLYVTGSSDQENSIRVGAMSAIVLPDPQSKVAYAEFSGGGLGAIQATMEAKQAQMAVLGAQVFHDGPKGVEAAETARIRTSGESSLLMAVVTAVEEVLKAAMECAANWMGASGEVEITLNRDWVDAGLDGPMLLALVAAYQAGALSLTAFLHTLNQAEILPPDTDLAEEETKLVAVAKQKADEAIRVSQATKPKPAV